MKILRLIVLAAILSLVMHGAGELFKRYFNTPAAYLMVCITEPEHDKWSCGTAEELLADVEKAKK